MYAYLLRATQSTASAKVFALPSEMLKSLVVGPKETETAFDRYSNDCEVWTIQNILCAA
jgi:hypothetical protein